MRTVKVLIALVGFLMIAGPLTPWVGRLVRWLRATGQERAGWRTLDRLRRHL